MGAARASAALIALVAAAAALAAPSPARADDRLAVEVVVDRGVGGVVPAGGIDVVVVEVRSRLAMPARVQVAVAGAAPQPIELAAHGRATVTLAARVGPGVSALPARAVRVSRGADGADGEVPAVRVVARPVIVVTDGAAALLPRVDVWRRGEQLGDPVVVAPEAVPARWQALFGAGAVVIDRPIAALGELAARTIRRHLAAGGTVCRLDVADAAPPRCARAAPLALPRTRQTAPIAAVPRALALVGLGLAATLLGAVALRRRWPRAAATLAVAACAAATLLPLLLATAPAIAVRGVRADAGGGEDWVVAEVGASELLGAAALGDELWIEVSGDPGGGALGVVGLAGAVPGAGSYRIRGFVAADARGWTGALARAPRAPPESP